MAMMTKLHRSQFLKEIKESFPELRDDLNQQWGLLHLEMHAIYRFVQDRIDEEDRGSVDQAFQLADKYVRAGNADLVNALVVSFLGHLNFQDGKAKRNWAKSHMTKALLMQYEMLMALD